MTKLQQIVVQISNVDSERSILQYGEGFLPDQQRFIESEGSGLRCWR